jgi:NRAMP (natural resistance-associated macrophage protein)-like metal ion transporter
MRGPAGRMLRGWRALGPGLITGAADDDPSGIATYSIAGAQFGTGLLWTAPLTWPLMAAVQFACARVGMVTGRGLMAAFRHRIPRPALFIVAVLLFLANTLNIGADIAGMADAAELLTGVPSHLWVVALGGLIALATVRLRYAHFAGTLKWLALVLLVYVVAVVDLRPDWPAVLRATLVPELPRDRAAWQTVVAILGTTISPYLFFWQASQEVEEEKARGRRTLAARQGATEAELRARRWDVGIGTLASNVVMFAIILTTALTLHVHGLTSVQSSAEVASALEPLAGSFATTLYTLGIVGTGMLAIPTLAGSAAYAFADLLAWRQGMDERASRARAFYAVVGAAIFGGAALDFANVNPVRALYWSAVVNGCLAPLLLAGLVLVMGDRAFMRGQPASRLSRLMVAGTALLMTGAAVAMVIG